MLLRSVVLRPDPRNVWVVSVVKLRSLQDVIQIRRLDSVGENIGNHLSCGHPIGHRFRWCAADRAETARPALLVCRPLEMILVCGGGRTRMCRLSEP